MKSNESSHRRPSLSWMLLAALLLNYSLADAQSTPEQKPDLSNKALITKQTPAPSPASQRTKVFFEAIHDRAIHGDDARSAASSFRRTRNRSSSTATRAGSSTFTPSRSTGGEPKQLTNSTKESTYAISYFPGTRVSSIATTRAATRTASLFARTRWERARPDSRRENEGELPRLEPRPEVVLLLHQRSAIRSFSISSR